MAKKAPPPAEQAVVDATFPALGLDTSEAAAEQPAGTAAVGKNVRWLEPVGLRRRGGQRSGIGKHVNALVSGSSAIQELNTVVRADGNAIGVTPTPTPTPTPGGFPPTGLQWNVNYVLTSSGFTINTRLLSEMTTRGSTLFNNQNILGATTSPERDFPDVTGNYVMKLTAVDQSSNAVGMSGQTTILVPLSVNTSGGVTYLGTPSVTYLWSTVYASNPGTTTYTVTATLLDFNSATIQARDANGALVSNTFLRQVFSATTGVGGGMAAKEYEFHVYSFGASNKVGSGTSPAPFGNPSNQVAKRIATFYCGVRQLDSWSAQPEDGLKGRQDAGNVAASIWSFDQALSGRHTDGFKIGGASDAEMFDRSTWSGYAEADVLSPSGPPFDLLLQHPVVWTDSLNSSTHYVLDAKLILEFWGGYGCTMASTFGSVPDSAACAPIMARLLAEVLA